MAFSQTNVTNIRTVVAKIESHNQHSHKLIILCEYLFFCLCRYMKATEISWPFPVYVGECGRLLVLEGPWIPLKQFLNKSWKARADLAVQVMQMIDLFSSGDSELLLMVNDFNIDHFIVDDEGRVLYSDLSNVLIAERAFTGAEGGTGGAAKAEKVKCNEQCFKTFTSDLYSTNPATRASACPKLDIMAGNIMHSLACKHILSDLDTHKQSRPHGQRLPGLLHTFPDKHKDELNEMLEECVDEKEPGGRLQSVEELQDILQEYVDQEL